MIASTILENICLPSYNKIRKGFYISNSAERQFAEKCAEVLSVKMDNIRQNVMYLSGGNKQKVAVAKWLGTEADIYIFDCPTRGIDVGVQSDIYDLLEDLRKQKKAILQGITVDNFMNIKTIKYLNVGKYAHDRLAQGQIEAEDIMINPKHIAYFRLVDIIGVAPFITNIYLAQANIALLTLVIMADWMINNARYALINLSENLIERKTSRDIIKDLKGDDTYDFDTMPDEGIVLKDVFFDYGKDSIKFHIDELSFPKGSKTLVYGESGEGKSSLANLLAGGIKPTVGSVPAINTYYIWQETESLDDSLWHNIVFSNDDNIDQIEILDLFKKLSMTSWFCTLQDGFDTQIGERGCKLSSGQKQRINIIRMLLAMKYHPDKLFIMDEITSNLDKDTRELAIKLFEEAFKNENMTVICISHNEGFDKICDRKILVKDHKFKEE